MNQTKEVAMKRHIIASFMIASFTGLCAAPYLAAQAQPVTQPYPVIEGLSYKFDKIADVRQGELVGHPRIP